MISPAFQFLPANSGFGSYSTSELTWRMSGWSESRFDWKRAGGSWFILRNPYESIYSSALAMTEHRDTADSSPFLHDWLELSC